MKLIVFLIVLLCFIYIWEKFVNFIKRKQKYRKWIKEEWKFRDTKGYPEDWSYRRELIIRKFKSKCISCDERIENNIHIHHIVPISKGGDHSLDNLELLCEKCHCEKHPKLKTLIDKNQIYRRLSNKARFVKSSTKDYNCYCCGDIIKKNSSYYGDRKIKLCINCLPSKIKD